MRHHFSLNTCSGCHGGETSTTFLHVGLANFGTVAPLSGFLTGTSVTDPVDGTTSRPFNDLERRRNSLEDLLCKPCKGFKTFELIATLRFKPVHMTH